jgi:acyl-coenzyme A synthetase/AMP-(fatty) acid ligase
VVLRRPCGDGELREFLRARLAPFKVPRAFIEVRELPRTAAGKLDRAALAELFSR